jgi:putative SOS response-associated peptidase YedK
MCGRFSLTAPADLVAEIFDLDDELELSPHYNVAPTQPILAVRDVAYGREAFSPRWGLVSPATRGRAAPLINARVETVSERVAFREPFHHRRCLIPADGFYEWMRGAKRAFHFSLADGAPFGFAGLWEPGDADTSSCVILTTTPNELVAEVHDRMPVILERSGFQSWLEARDPRDAEPWRVPLRAARMRVREVGRSVNDVRNDGPECQEPPRERRLF